jgi:hypothetical protein
MPVIPGFAESLFILHVCPQLLSHPWLQLLSHSLHPEDFWNSP